MYVCSAIESMAYYHCHPLSSVVLEVLALEVRVFDLVLEVHVVVS